MPSYNSDILPASGGLSLGQPLQVWDACLGNTTIQELAIGSSNSYFYTPSGVVYTSASPVTANANTVVKQNLMTFDVPANALNSVGKILRLKMSGSYSTQGGQTPVMAIRTSLNSAIATEPFTTALLANSANYHWNGVLDLVVATAGSSALLEPLSTFAWGSLVTTTEDASALAQIGPVDTTNPITVLVSVSFSTNTNPSNVCVQRLMIAEILN